MSMVLVNNDICLIVVVKSIYTFTAKFYIIGLNSDFSI